MLKVNGELAEFDTFNHAKPLAASGEF